ncbi:MAG: hypothetical protein A2Y21_02240 [Clostridiales bacterium GWC2_40_7]|nr:MAG: hypothetical protein A2Y21_02240 [Clostridiales bacterium GWC2_40_7]
MKIRWIFPEKFNKKWFPIFIAYTLILFCLPTGIRFLGINPKLDPSALHKSCKSCLICDKVVVSYEIITSNNNY